MRFRLDLQQTFALKAARWVRFTASLLSNTSAWVYEAQVFGATYPITLPDANHIRLCNYAGQTRDFTLAVTR